MEKFNTKQKRDLLRFTPIIILLFLIQTGCKDSPINPPQEQKIGWQDDIHWSSLGDNPWPTLQADMQRTGRSKYSGPTQGIVFTKLPARYMESGIAFGSDSVFYYVTYPSSRLTAADINGNIRWSTDPIAYEIMSTPLVSANGTIYLAYDKIFAFNPDGTKKWEYATGNIVYNRGLGLGQDGTIYSITNQSTLIALNQNGDLLWQIQDEQFGGGSRINLTFSPDGNTMYIAGNRVGLEEITIIAFDLVNREIKWKFGHEILWNGPMVDAQGNIYLFVEDDSLDNSKANFYSLKSDGSIRWKYSHTRGGMYSGTDPTIDKEGNIYFATDTLYALDYSGNLRWKINLGMNISSSLICDADGTVFAAVFNNGPGSTIYAVTRDGNIRWSLFADADRGLESAAISKNGTLIYPNFRTDHLYIIK